MSTLKYAGLVSSEKRGKWVYYKLSDGMDDTAAHTLLGWVFDNVGASEEVKRDRERLKTITCPR
jgi:DNA-binding transcriptional ArsR family regulator